jgi:HSP20 family molecular chaperone IbpA
MVLVTYPFDALAMDIMMDTYPNRNSCKRQKTEPATRNPIYRTNSTEAADILEVELPGVAKGDVKLDVTGLRLHISGARYEAKSDHEVPQGDGDETSEANQESGEAAPKMVPVVKYISSFSLSHKHADVGRISAEYNDGLLRVTVPRKAEVSRHIEIDG